jgi:Amidase
MADEWQLSLAEAATAIGNSDITAELLAISLLTRAEANEHLNAFVARDSDKILEAARAADLARRQGKRLRLLHGVPICVKDNIDAVDDGVNEIRCAGLNRPVATSSTPTSPSLSFDGRDLWKVRPRSALSVGRPTAKTLNGQLTDPRLATAVDDQFGHHGACTGAELEAMCRESELMIEPLVTRARSKNGQFVARRRLSSPKTAPIRSVRFRRACASPARSRCGPGRVLRDDRRRSVPCHWGTA